jgi:hypothetical protein
MAQLISGAMSLKERFAVSRTSEDWPLATTGLMKLSSPLFASPPHSPTFSNNQMSLDPKNSKPKNPL